VEDCSCSRYPEFEQQMDRTVEAVAEAVSWVFSESNLCVSARREAMRRLVLAMSESTGGTDWTNRLREGLN